MRWMRGLGLFVAGTFVGMLIMQASAAPQEKPAIGLNHVGVYVNNLEESLNFYTNTMGFRKAFTVTTPEGKLASVYVQVSRDTFLEVVPADADHPAGFSHAAFWVDDVRATNDRLRRAGAKVQEPHVGMTKALISDVFDPNGLRLEMLEMVPGSMQRKAVDSWR
jgi:catechol 2,3-dioxygenase-like lactoylglutathione lyase family enzyme